MKINEIIQKLSLFIKSDTGRLWIRRAILFIIILLGLRWAIATGVKKGTRQELWGIEKGLQDISEEMSAFHKTSLLNFAVSEEKRQEMMTGRLIEFQSKFRGK